MEALVGRSGGHALKSMQHFGLRMNRKEEAGAALVISENQDARTKSVLGRDACNEPKSAGLDSNNTLEPSRFSKELLAWWALARVGRRCQV